MNENETIELLQRRQNVARIAYNPVTVAHWRQSLHDVQLIDALRAFEAIVAIGENDVSIPRIRGWLRSERRRNVTGAPPGDPECEHCGGTGWDVWTITHGVARYGPCFFCHPEHNEHRHRPEPVVNDSVDKPVRFAATDPDAVAARREWFRNGAQGHYPGCPCGAHFFTEDRA